MAAKVKKTKVKKTAAKKSIFQDLMEMESEEDEVMENSNDNDATEEEVAFLKSITKKERMAASKADQSSDEESE